jgi:hypothetical protein
LRVHLDHFGLTVLRIRRANTGEGEKRAQHAYVNKYLFHARFHHEKDFAAAGELGVAMRAPFPRLELEHKPSWEFNPGSVRPRNRRVVSMVGRRTPLAKSNEGFADALL